MRPSATSNFVLFYQARILEGIRERRNIKMMMFLKEDVVASALDHSASRFPRGGCGGDDRSDNNIDGWLLLLLFLLDLSLRRCVEPTSTMRQFSTCKGTVFQLSK
jgi:hypothetical protein